MDPNIPDPPETAGEGGRRLWSAVLADYTFEEHELSLLREAVRTVDALDGLHELTEAEGLVVTGPHGSKPHPALVEARQLRIALARLLAALRLPAGEEDDGSERRPQRRVGVRGVYGVAG
jgi:hypothetical protein